MGWIAERILSEHDKYEGVLEEPDGWAIIAELKIIASLKQKKFVKDVYVDDSEIELIPFGTCGCNKL